MRRAGELAKQMMQPNHRPSADKYDGSDILMPKAKVQEFSGFSERQLNTSLRVASIPEREFTEQVESANPPTQPRRPASLSISPKLSAEIPQTVLLYAAAVRASRSDAWLASNAATAAWAELSGQVCNSLALDA